MSVFIVAKGSDDDSFFMKLSDRNFFTLARQLRIRPKGKLPVSVVRKKVQKLRERLDQYSLFEREEIERETVVIRASGGNVTIPGLDLEQFKGYLNGLEEIAKVAGDNGIIQWG